MKLRFRLTLDNVIMFVFLLYMITFHIFSYRPETLIISEIVIFLLLALLFLYFMSQRNFIVGWRLFFVLSWNLIVVIGYFWSPEQDETFSRWMTIFQLTVFFVLFSHFLDSDKKIGQAIASMTISYVVLGVYMVYEYGISTLLDGNFTRLGNEISQINILGMSLAFGSVFCFYYFYQRNKKLMLIPMIFLILMSSFTGSRKALIIIFLGVNMLMVQDFKKNRKRFFRYAIIILITFGVLLSFASFDLVISRVESALSILSGGTELDSSTRLRLKMIETGLRQFIKRPIIGTGFESFRYYWMDVAGKKTYSHNNYVELLVSGGIIAACIYYGTYIYLLVGMYKRRSGDGMLLMTMLMITLAVDLFLVSYYSKDTYIMLAIYFAYIYHHDRKVGYDKKMDAA